MFAAVQCGKITEKEWTEYCMEVLSEVMDRNADVFIRLKNRL
jgi:hypothetical protein